MRQPSPSDQRRIGLGDPRVEDPSGKEYHVARLNRKHGAWS